MKTEIKLCLMCLVLCGCSIPAPTPKSMDEIILRENFYTTATGKSLSEKYRDKLEHIANSIRGNFSFLELEFSNPSEGMNANGLFFGVEQNDVKKERIYLCVNMYTTTRFNTLQSNYNSRVATVFTKYGRPLFNKLYVSGIAADENVVGISVGLLWYAENFVHYQGSWEAFNIFAKTEDVKQFLNNEITDQDFIGKAKNYGSQGSNLLGLIELNLSERM